MKIRMGQRGQTSFEFLIATLLGMVIILGVIQLALMFNAHSILKLAAFNAARAAIVARGENPEDPVTLDQMKKKAKLAAFMTIIPVIPAIQGSGVPKSLSDIPNVIENFIDQGIKNFGTRALIVLAEYLLFLEVEFVDPRAPDASDDDAVLEVSEVIEFDDVEKAADNVIKVVVTWKYPLMIPFVNQIIVASMEPGRYALARGSQVVQSGGNPTQLLVTGDEYNEIPVWARGTSFTANEANRFAFWVLGGNRITMRATYVMRMQWDRGPGG